MISRIIKIEVGVISRRQRRLRLITLSETLIILDMAITETNSNTCTLKVIKKNGSHVFASSLRASDTITADSENLLYAFD